MSVAAINTFFAQETGRFAKELLQKKITISPIAHLMQEGKWDEQMGNSHQVVTFGRTLPAATYSDGGAVLNPAYSAAYWTNIGAEPGDTTANNCTPPTTVLKMGNDKATFNLQHMAVESEPICVTDAMNTWQWERQLGAIKKNLMDNTAWLQVEKYRRDYTYFCDHKVVINTVQIAESEAAGGITGSADFNFTGSGPTVLNGAGAGAGTPGKLRLEYLDELYQDLVRDTAGDGAFGEADGSPVFAIITDGTTAGAIKRETKVRDDFHWSDRSNELLQALNVRTAPVHGFQFLIDPTPPRWNVSGGLWVKVEPYIVKAANGAGWKIEKNPAYRTAAWQDTIVWNSKLIEMVYPGSQGNSQGTGFVPVNYRGEWYWQNVISKEPNSTVYNPDGTIGNFRGVLMMGAMPGYTGYGVIIRHARCVSTPQYSDCSTD